MGGSEPFGGRGDKSVRPHVALVPPDAGRSGKLARGVSHVCDAERVTRLLYD